MANTPNLLMIVVDQQRFDCIGFAARYPVSTPNIDRLATEGVWFEHAFSHIPLCSPARQSLIHGTRPESFGALWNYNNGLKVQALQPEHYAWTRELVAANYHTAYIGKWNVNPTHDPTKYGYLQYVSEKEYEHYQAKRYPSVMFTNGYPGEVSPIPAEDARPHWIAKQACNLLADLHAGHQPWHLRVDFPEPHLPCRPSASFAQMYDSSQVPMWHNFSETFQQKPYIQQQQLYNWGIENWSWEDWAPIVARYYAIISQVDAAIGEILQQLEDLSVAENTIVVFTADHGDLCGAHRMMDKHYVLYDDVIRVPLIIRWPNGIRGGRTIDSFVYNFLDLPPTLLELLKIPSNGIFHGDSFAPMLCGETIERWRNEVVATYNGQQFGLYTQRMIRTSEFKYVWNTTDVDEFYDLTNDPGELVNRIYDPAFKHLIQQLREKLYAELHRCDDGLVNSTWMKHQLQRGSKL